MQLSVIINNALEANISASDDDIIGEVGNDDECKKYTADQVRQAIKDFRAKQPAMTTNIPGFEKWQKSQK